MRERATNPALAALPETRITARPPFISVIVPIRNEAAFIEETLLRLIHQEYDADRFEILVADGRSTDATRSIVESLQGWQDNLRLLDNPKQWSSAGRNVAIRAARGDLVVVIDGHCEVDNPHYLSDLAEAFARSGADCVGRPQPLDVTRASLLQRAIAAARTSRLGHHPDSHIYSTREGFVPPHSVAVAYRRTTLERIGLFDESFDACEDVELNHRIAKAGGRCFFTPRVQVRYHPRGTLAGLFRQMVRYGRGRVRLARKHPETFTIPGFVPGAFLAGVVGGPLVSLVWPMLLFVYAGVLGLYAAAVLCVTLLLSVRHREPRWLGLLPVVFATIHLGAGYGIWRELFTRRPASATPTLVRETASTARRRLIHPRRGTAS